MIGYIIGQIHSGNADYLNLWKVSKVTFILSDDQADEE